MHTELPWQATGLDDSILDEYGNVESQEPHIEAADGTIICQLAGGLPLHEVNENAAFIVRAVNAHDALVAALEGAIATEEGNWTKDPDGEPEWMIAARAALAIAKGE